MLILIDHFLTQGDIALWDPLQKHSVQRAHHQQVLGQSQSRHANHASQAVAESLERL